LTLLLVLDVQKQVGANVRTLRLKRKWSQDVFADRSGLNRAHVGEIERGESNVTIQTLKIVADTLGVKISDLVRNL
jgi:transcriptional regulator with XRE-family HTH domain